MKHWRPVIRYNDKFLDFISWFIQIGGISLFPFIVLREKYRDGGVFWVTRAKRVINHETIHFQQSLELLVIPFYILYIIEWFIKLFFYGKKAYRNISFEREAYNNDDNINYLYTRKRYGWIKHIFINNTTA